MAGDGISGRLCLSSLTSVVRFKGEKNVFKFGPIFVSLTVLRDGRGGLQSQQAETVLEGCISLGKETVGSPTQE